MKPLASLAVSVLASCAALSGVVSGAAETQGGCILYGEGWAVALSAPSGWTISCRDPNTNGVEAALWPSKSTWKDSVAVMYVNSAVAKSGETLEAFVDDAVARFKAQQPGVGVKEGHPVKTADGKPGSMRYFSGDQWDNHEAVAYVDAGPARLIFVLSSRSKRDFRRNESALVSLVTTAHVRKATIRSE